jgi:RING finger protein 113A
MGDEPGSSDEDDEIPFACLICRNAFVDPVVTKCGHYFDSACAIKRFAKTPKCFACGAPTGGMFNSATAVLKKLEAKQKAKDERRREERGTPELEDGNGGFRIESGDEDDG